VVVGPLHGQLDHIVLGRHRVRRAAAVCVLEDDARLDAALAREGKRCRESLKPGRDIDRARTRGSRILLAPVTFFVVPSEVRYMYENLDGERSPVSGIYGLWFLLPLIGSLIWFIQVQGALNRIGRGRAPFRLSASSHPNPGVPWRSE
jgi:hypothetical protein